MIRPNAVARGAYKFEKIFSDGEYMAGGILEIPVGSKKPIKPARDNSYVRAGAAARRWTRSQCAVL
jgi:centromere protein C